MGEFARCGRQLIMEIANGVVGGFTDLHRRGWLGWTLLGMAVALGDYLLLAHMAGK